MIILAALFLAINFNVFAGVCDNKSSQFIDNGHVHLIYPSENRLNNSKRYSKLTKANKEVSVQVELNLVGFETFKGGTKVVGDLKIAKARLEQVISSEQFKEAVYNHTYNKTKQFKKNNTFSNGQVYKAILNGADKYNPAIDNQIDMTLCPYYSSKNVIGYTYSNRKEVWINFKYYRDRANDFQVSDMVGNILHEWLHNASFSHSSSNNSTRVYTVPYGVGYISRDLASLLD